MRYLWVLLLFSLFPLLLPVRGESIYFQIWILVLNPWHAWLGQSVWSVFGVYSVLCLVHSLCWKGTYYHQRKGHSWTRRCLLLLKYFDLEVYLCRIAKLLFFSEKKEKSAPSAFSSRVSRKVHITKSKKHETCYHLDRLQLCNQLWFMSWHMWFWLGCLCTFFVLSILDRGIPYFSRTCSSKVSCIVSNAFTKPTEIIKDSNPCCLLNIRALFTICWASWHPMQSNCEVAPNCFCHCNSLLSYDDVYYFIWLFF